MSYVGGMELIGYIEEKIEASEREYVVKPSVYIVLKLMEGDGAVGTLESQVEKALDICCSEELIKDRMMEELCEKHGYYRKLKKERIKEIVWFHIGKSREEMLLHCDMTTNEPDEIETDLETCYVETIFGYVEIGM